MILIIRKIIHIFIIFKLRKKNDLSYIDLNFKKIDFTNYNQIKNFIFKKKIF